jgi:hypothetical protein
MVKTMRTAAISGHQFPGLTTTGSALLAATRPTSLTPREIQEIAFAKGMIPRIPTDKDDQP